MSTEIIKYADIALFSIAAIAGIVILFRNTRFSWKCFSLAAIIWALTSLFQLYVPSIPADIVAYIQRLGIGLCLALGLISYKQ